MCRGMSGKIAAYLSRIIRENCVTVDMEASAYIAVSHYNKVEFGQILYAGDNLFGTEWECRGWDSQVAIRENVLRIALEACVAM